jgi:hypothetical protein
MKWSLLMAVLVVLSIAGGVILEISNQELISASNPFIEGRLIDRGSEKRPMKGYRGSQGLGISPVSSGDGEVAGPTADWQLWFTGDVGQEWTSEELNMIREALSNTSKTLNQAGIDGHQLLSGYRFRRAAGEFVDPDSRKIAIVKHDIQEIWLADAAFSRLQGFYIYHELGHAVDHRLNRGLSQAYHHQTNGGTIEEGSFSKWQSGDGYWLRPHGRDVREEATADALALLTMSQSGSVLRPVFGGTPLDVDYDGITLEAYNAVQAVSMGARIR